MGWGWGDCSQREAGLPAQRKPLVAIAQTIERACRTQPAKSNVILVEGHQWAFGVQNAVEAIRMAFAIGGTEYRCCVNTELDEKLRTIQGAHYIPDNDRNVQPFPCRPYSQHVHQS